MNKFYFFLLMSPLVWWIGAMFFFNTIKGEDEDKKIGSIVIGVFILLAFWGLYFS